MNKKNIILICICLVLIVSISYLLMLNITIKTELNSKIILDEQKVRYSAQENNQGILIDEHVNNFSIELISKKNNNTFEIKVISKNIFDGNFKTGYIDAAKNNYELIGTDNPNYRTTDWINIPNQELKYISLSGDAFNRAVWQFMLNDGRMICSSEMINYRSIDAIWGNKSSSTVEIPENTKSFRVYYAKLNDEKSLPLGDKIQIEFGGIPTNYEPYHIENISLGNLNKNEKFIYGNGIFKKYDKFGKYEVINLEKIINLKQKDCIIVNSAKYYNINIDVDVDTDISNEKNRVYGISWSEDGNVFCKRIADSEKFNTNYQIGENYVSPYKNDFDEVFPWCDIKLCNITYDENRRKKYYL